MDLEFYVSNQSCKRLDSNSVVNLSQGYLDLSFKFGTPDWDNVAKFALFKFKGETYRVGLVNDKCTVPNAVLLGDRFSFSLYGVSGDSVRVTTNRVLVYLSDSGFTKDIVNDLPDSDPDVVEQIYIAIESAETDSKAYTDSLRTDVNSDITEINRVIDSVTVVKQATSDTGYFSTYYVEVDGNRVGSKINIPRDYLLKSASLRQCTVKDTPITGLNVGDWYFDWVINTTDSTGQASHLYLNANVLTDVYEPDGSTILITDGVISVKPNVFADKVHAHTKSQITDFAHNHDERYYTEAEVNAIVDGLLNRVSLNASTDIVQKTGTTSLIGYVLRNGAPAVGETVYFFEEVQPTLTISGSSDVVEDDSTVDIVGTLIDTIDGSKMVGETVYFFEQFTGGLSIGSSSDVVEDDSTVDLFAVLKDTEDGSRVVGETVYFFAEEEE